MADPVSQHYTAPDNYTSPQPTQFNGLPQPYDSSSGNFTTIRGGKAATERRG
ncbi:hypothetical protein ACLOJK_022574, partial [Asimina triloba]